MEHMPDCTWVRAIRVIVSQIKCTGLGLFTSVTRRIEMGEGSSLTIGETSEG
jgi:hypothetical protein